MKPQLLTTAELLQTCGFALPADPERTSAEAELLLEAAYENLDIKRFAGNLEAGAAEVHTYSLADEQSAEEGHAAELAPQSRTKMVLARCLHRNEALEDGETLQTLWPQALATLQERATPFRVAPPAPLAPPVPPALAGARGRGRGRGRGRARGRAARG